MSIGDDRDASVNGGSKDADPFQLGNRLAERGEMDQAEEAYRRADEDGHGTAAAYAGVFAEARGDFEEARDAYRRADERGDGFGALRLGLLSAARGDWDEAKDAYARADERGHEQPPFDPRSLRSKRPPRDNRPAAVADGRPAFANPVLIGAVTVLIADHRGVPGLQRQHRAAVRADEGAEGRHRQRLEPGRRQRRAIGRLPSRRDQRDEADPASQWPDRRAADPSPRSDPPRGPG